MKNEVGSFRFQNRNNYALILLIFCFIGRSEVASYKFHDHRLSTTINQRSEMGFCSPYSVSRYLLNKGVNWTLETGTSILFICTDK